MRRFRTAALALAIAVSAAAPVVADEDASTERAVRGVLETLRARVLSELDPGAIDSMLDGLAGWQELMRLLGDYSAFEMPLVLPNGDIIIRRKAPENDDQPAPGEAAPGAEGPLDL